LGQTAAVPDDVFVRAGDSQLLEPLRHDLGQADPAAVADYRRGQLVQALDQVLHLLAVEEVGSTYGTLTEEREETRMRKAEVVRACAEDDFSLAL